MTTASELDSELENMAQKELDAEATADEQARPHSRSQSRSDSQWTRRPRTEMVSSSRGQGVSDKDIAVATHIGTIAAAVFSGGFFDIIVPLVAYVIYKDRSQFLREHIRRQLNFQLTNLLVAAAAVVFSIVTFGIGLVVAVPVLIAYFVVDVVCSIRAAMAASRGHEYQFPMSFDLV